MRLKRKGGGNGEGRKGRVYSVGLFIDVDRNYFAFRVNSSLKAVLLVENYSANGFCFTILINPGDCYMIRF